MKKMNYLLVAAGLLFFLFFALDNISAQDASVVGSNAKINIDKPIIIPPLVDDATSAARLSSSFKNIMQNMGGLPVAEEVKANIKVQYHSQLAEKIFRGEEIETLLPKSIPMLQKIYFKFSPDYWPEIEDVFQETIDLLKQ